MPAFPLLAPSLLAAAVLIWLSARSRRPLPPAGAPAVVRFAELGSTSLAAQTQVVVELAPRTAAEAALRLRTADGGVVAEVRASDVTAYRAWHRGGLVLVTPDAGRGTPRLAPLDASLAGWELEIAVRGGAHLRLYGPDEAELATLFGPLRARLRAAAAERPTAAHDHPLPPRALAFGA